MLSLLPGGRIPVAVDPVDGGKGVDSLAGVVRSVLKGDPLSGDLFVFRTRRADKLKNLAWMGDGFALDLRRLEKGTFAFSTAGEACVAVTPTTRRRCSCGRVGRRSPGCIWAILQTLPPCST